MTSSSEKQQVEWPGELWRVQVVGLVNPEGFHTTDERVARGWEETGAQAQRYVPATQQSGRPTMPNQPWAAAFTKQMALKGAISSVALSHPEDCTCLTCKAAHGDEEAFARLLEAQYLESNRG